MTLQTGGTSSSSRDNDEVHEVEVVVAHKERATVRVGEVFLKIDADQTRTDVEVEAMRAPIPVPEVAAHGSKALGEVTAASLCRDRRRDTGTRPAA